MFTLKLLSILIMIFSMLVLFYNFVIINDVLVQKVTQKVMISKMNCTEKSYLQITVLIFPI